MRRTLLFAALSIACLLATVSALAENAGVGQGAIGRRSVEASAPEPYRAGPLRARAAASEPVLPFQGAGEGAALVTLLALGLGLRWADRAGAARRRMPARAWPQGARTTR